MVAKVLHKLQLNKTSKKEMLTAQKLAFICTDINDN